MDLPVVPPIRPMLAKATTELPDRDDIIFEPKWDGFRCIIFRDGDEVEFGSRNSKPLTRYFPELIQPVLESFPKRCVIDGELIIAGGDRLEFEALQQRIHPAESRINMLAEETPASFVAFDILAEGDEDLREQPFSERRARLVRALQHVNAPVYLTATTTDRAEAQRWFVDFEGAGLDGLIAKPVDEPYAENKRSQIKVKHTRTADAVVAGYRWHKDGAGIGSLILGLWEDGKLRHVGVAASFTKKRRAELVAELEPLTQDAVKEHPWRSWIVGNEDGSSSAGSSSEESTAQQVPGTPNRWSAARDQSWTPIRIERVAEVKYSTTLGGRFRDVTKMLRWRPDKDPKDCDHDQLEEPPAYAVADVLQANG